MIPHEESIILATCILARTQSTDTFHSGRDLGLRRPYTLHLVVNEMEACVGPSEENHRLLEESRFHEMLIRESQHLFQNLEVGYWGLLSAPPRLR